MAAPPPLPEDYLHSLKARYVTAVRAASDVNAASFFSKAAFVVMVMTAASIVLLPLTFVVYPRWRSLRMLYRFARDAVRFAERAQPVMSFPVMVNSNWRKPDSAPSAGLVLISFDEQKGGSIGYMGSLADSIIRGSADMSAPDREFCRALIEDEQYVPFRRRRLPNSITGGTEVFACDLSIAPQLLLGGRFSDEMPLIPCMADVGEVGWISQIPNWVMAETDAPDTEAEKVFGVSLLSLSGLAANA